MFSFSQQINNFNPQNKISIFLSQLRIIHKMRYNKLQKLLNRRNTINTFISNSINITTSKKSFNRIKNCYIFSCLIYFKRSLNSPITIYRSFTYNNSKTTFSISKTSNPIRIQSNNCTKIITYNIIKPNIVAN